MAEVLIRRAAADDAPTLAQAQRAIAATPGLLASRPDELPDEVLRRKIVDLHGDGRGVVLVAEQDAALIGHGLLQPYTLAVTAHIVELTLAVHLGQHGRGVGHQLMLALIAWARAAAHVEKIELRVRASNDRALALYRRVGFVEEGRFSRRIKLGPDTYLDDVAMGLWVGSNT